MKTSAFVISILAGVSIASAYVRSTDSTGSHLLKRTDNSAIQFYFNSSTAPGIKNRDGKFFITPDSTPVSAIKQAMTSWQASSGANIAFLPLKSTSAGFDTKDGQNVIVFQDTDAIRAAVGGANAVTISSYKMDDFHMVDNDILFNPAVTFSTTGADGSIDLEAVIAHEIGHALGANHNNLLGATMFQQFFSNVPGSPLGVFARSLSTDETAFAAAVYPASGVATGTISGTVSLAGGGSAKSPLLTLTDVSNGTTVGVLAGQDGKYSVTVLAGSYQIYAEPFNSIVQPGNLYLSSAVAVDTAFKAGYYGGNASPGTVTVGKDGSVTADIQAVNGATALSVDYLVIAGAGAKGDLTSISTFTGATTILSGQSVDIVIVGRGLTSAFVSDPTASLRVIGQGVTVRPGSVRIDDSYPTFAPLLRATLDLAPLTTTTLATVFLTKGPDSLSLSGVLAILPPKPVFTSQSVTNSASFATGAISPGEIVSIFGANLGPAAGADITPVGFDPTTGGFPSGLDGVQVTFDGVIAPIYYARNDLVNVQVPFEVAGKANTKVVVSYNGVMSDPVNLPAVGYTPAIYTYNGSGKGPGIVVNQDYSLNTAANPAPRGSVVTVYLTGRGPVDYSIQTGKPAPTPPINAGGFTCSIGGVSADVGFGGWTPTAVGLAQVNATVPAGISPGEQALTVLVGGVPSQGAVTMFVK